MHLLHWEIKPLQNELRGRVFSILGFVIGETSIDPETLEPKSIDRLRHAITNCQKAYEMLQKAGEAEPAEYQALNNLIFYSCLIHERSKGSLILEKARLLRDAGQAHENRNLLLTYTRAVLEFGSSQTERAEAIAILQDILQHPRSSEGERREAKQYLDLSSSSPTSQPQQPAST